MLSVINLYVCCFLNDRNFLKTNAQSSKQHFLFGMVPDSNTSYQIAIRQHKMRYSDAYIQFFRKFRKQNNLINLTANMPNRLRKICPDIISQVHAFLLLSTVLRCSTSFPHSPVAKHHKNTRNSPKDVKILNVLESARGR